MKPVQKIGLLALTLAGTQTERVCAFQLSFPTQLPKAVVRKLNNFVSAAASVTAEGSPQLHPQSSSSVTSSPPSGSTSSAANSHEVSPLLSARKTSHDEQLAKEIEALKEASDKGSRDASKKLGEYYKQCGNLYEDDAIFYCKRFHQQFLDGATESELKTFENQAKTDSEQAEFLAECYENQQAKRYNAKKALELYTRAANFENLNALWHLGQCYLSGDMLTPCDSEKACHYYRECADQNYPLAFITLAYLTKYGIGTPKDDTVAKELMARAFNKMEKELASQHLEELEQIKAGFCDGIVFDCTNQQCLFQEQEWWLPKDFFPSTCPKRFLSRNQIIYVCSYCHRAFHESCIHYWRKKWAITPAEGCPNPACLNQSHKLLRGTVL